MRGRAAAAPGTRGKALFPPGSEPAARALGLSPGIVSGGHVFLSGMTGSRADGSMPDDPAEQIRSAFGKIGAVLDEAGLTHAAIVEMTSFHVGLGDHFDLFRTILAEYLSEPFPAWTAVEVAGLRRKGAIVEIRVIART
jgi:enamine deaminase RidA (YjgF/YER057c/UK114 family)